jgi:hypothetical protein
MIYYLFLPNKMKLNHILYLSVLLLACKGEKQKDAVSNNVSLANEFIDGFYSFNRSTLESLMSSAKASQPNILYYQKWAECANYKVVKRADPIIKNDSLIVIPVTVKDDLMGALEIDFNVTDSFHITIKDGKIQSVETTSDDLPVYYEAKVWVKENRPEFISEVCVGIWEGGPTPCECVQGMIKGFADFTAGRK